MHTVAGCSRTVAGWSRTLQDGGTGSLAAMHRVAGLTSAWESRACSSRDGCIRFQPGQLGLQPLAHMVAGLAWNSRSCSSVANLVSRACVPATSASSFAPITRTWDTCGYRVDRQGLGRRSGSGYMALACLRAHALTLPLLRSRPPMPPLPRSGTSGTTGAISSESSLSLISAA